MYPDHWGMGHLLIGPCQNKPSCFEVLQLACDADLGDPSFLMHCMIFCCSLLMLILDLAHEMSRALCPSRTQVLTLQWILPGVHTGHAHWYKETSGLLKWKRGLMLDHTQ